MEPTLPDLNALGYELARARPEVDPLDLTGEALAAIVEALPEFAGAFEEVGVGLDREMLHEIQMAWYDAARDLREP